MRWGSLLAVVCALGAVTACGDSDGGDDDSRPGEGSVGGDGSAGTSGRSGATSGGNGGRGASNGGSAGAGAPVPIEEFAAAIGRAFCTAISECFGSFASAFPQPDCQTNFENQFRNGNFAAVEAGIAAGRVTYDPALVPECLREFEAAGCDVFAQRDLDACEAALRGTLEPGEPCNNDSECAGAASCEPSASCPRVCTPLRGAGGPCESDSECQSGLNCDELVCGARAKMGQPCDGPSSPRCQIGLLCDGATETTPGTCVTSTSRATRREGETCNVLEFELCEPGLSCVFGGTDATYRCQQKAPSGGACQLGFPEHCPDGEYCDDTDAGDAAPGRCADLPGDGEPCLTGQSVRCSAELVCAAGSCVTRKANGETCRDAADCYSLRCDEGLCQGPELCVVD